MQGAPLDDAPRAPAPEAVLESVPWSSELAALAARFDRLTAVSDERGELSYVGLCARAHTLAGRLLASGLLPGEPGAR
jgi:hypothetical protein